MKKRMISILLLVTMLFTLLPAEAMAVVADHVNTAVNTVQENKKLENPFADIRDGSWYYDGVQYAHTNGFFSGTSATTFAPDGTMSRGMFVTVLGRMAGVDQTAYTGQPAFGDVPSDAYYAPFVAWASKHGITSGIGNGKFDPNGLINREQMATLFVRYFETFNVDYDTGANLTTAPADLDTVSPWARDAVLKLWKTGLLAGDGVNFNPAGNASRAQAATLCMRTDKAVETWYKEPGVPSDRVSINPDQEQKPKEQKPSSSGTSSGGSTTTYYEVDFALGTGEETEGVTLPPAASYRKGTPITSLPTPSKSGGIFLGWYYDSDLHNGVELDDTVQRNMTLYAKMAEGTEVTSIETPNYVTLTEQATNFTFQVQGVTSEADVKAAVTLTHITGGNTQLDYTLTASGDTWTVTASYEPGQTYQAELKNDSVQFVIAGETQETHIRYLNILTQKTEVSNFQLNQGIQYIKKSAVSDLSGGAYGGLVTMDVNTQSTHSNTTSGTFAYAGSNIAVGDTVAIYEGTRPDERNLLEENSDSGEVAYVKITQIDKTTNTYTYEMAEVEDVLFLPDVLPIAVSSETDIPDEQITITSADLTASLAAVEADALDVGDFVSFYTDDGDPGYINEAIISYGKITEVAPNADSYVITYESANEADIDSSLDVYYTQNYDIEMSDDEVSAIEEEIKGQVMASGYVEAASTYLAALAIETDGFSEIPENLDLQNCMLSLEDGTPLSDNEINLMAAKKPDVKVELDENEVSVTILANQKLDHLLDKKGLDVEVEVPFEVIIDKKVKITVTATFEQEVVLSQKISTSRIKIGFLKYDYAINTTFDIGNYTGINFTATVTAPGEDEDKSLVEQLDTIMEIMETQSKGGGVTSTDGSVESLADTYANLMESAGDTWTDIVNEKIFGTSGSAFLHIFCWEINISFVVSANVNVSMGMKFEYINQKQYNFSVRVKEKTSTNQTVDVIEPQYNFDFYVVGTMGVRAGVRLEIYVGLFSLKLDKVGITAETGVYVQLWGYFYYHLHWSQSTGKTQSSAGALLIELGVYLDIKFVAQLFSSNKLTWNPTIYSKQWPLWSAGEAQNVYAFDSGNNTYELKTVKTLALPGSTFTMKSMNMKDGAIGTVNKDDNEESSFIISFSNSKFRYDAKNNTVTVTPAAGSLQESAEMTIVWKRAPLSFTSKPISKVLTINWSDPIGRRYISFDPQGGSAVQGISAGSGADITWPADPIRHGYTFGGWYQEAECITPYERPSKMPVFPSGTQGITLYAKWAPSVVNYTVEHYQQELSGSYTLMNTDTQTLTSTTGTSTAAAVKSYAGFKAKDIAQQTIHADGSTVVKAYYDRNTYTITFSNGTVGGESINHSYRYGAEIQAPVLAKNGYTFKGWDPAIPESPAITVKDNATYTAQWQANDNTVTFNSQGGTTVESQTVQTGKTISKPADPTKPGYTFGGWYRNADCTAAWDFETKVTGPLTLYAKWTGATYIVTFDPSGGIVTPASKEVTYGSSYGSLPTPTKDGFTFAGWYTEASGGTRVTESTTVTAPLTLYARWTTATYTVTFHANGGTVTPTSMEAAYGSSYGTLPTPTRTGYTFDGWYTAASGGTLVTTTGTVTSTHTLFAHWTANTYTVAFDPNNGSGSMDSQTFIYGAAQNLTVNQFTRTGYTFTGWNTASNGTGTTYGNGQSVQNLTAEADGTVTLYAQWATEVATTYKVWVAGTQVNNVNMNDVLGDGGSVTYTPADGTNPQILTLTNANISAGISGRTGAFNAVIYVPSGSGKIVINVVGTNTVTNTYNDSSTAAEYIKGIYVHGILTFTGDGTLTVSTQETTATNNFAIYVGEGGAYATIDGPTINAYAGTGTKNSIGFLTRGPSDYSYSIYLNRGTLNAKGYTAAVSAYGVMASSNILTFTSAFTDYAGTTSGSSMEANTANCQLYKNIRITNSGT